MQFIAENISKSFGATNALDNVSVAFQSGEVRALVGENGAGKSTLLKILAAVHKKDSGSVMLDTHVYEPSNIQEAAQHGVAIVFQETTINPYLSIAENVFIDRLREFKKGYGLIDWKALRKAAQEIFDEMEVELDVNQDIRRLDLGQWKIIEIARALSYKPNFIFLDESTAFLSTKEVHAFLTEIEKLKNRGMGIGFVSHHLNEVFKVADTITVLKDGKWVRDCDVKNVTSTMVEALMVGREIGDDIYPQRTHAFSEEVVLSTQNLSINGMVQDIELTLHKGEILGIGGLKGAGGEQILQAIYGDIPYQHGKISLKDGEYHAESPGDALENSIAYVPGERTIEGLIANFSVMQNISMGALPRKGIFIDKPGELTMAQHYIAELKIKASHPNVLCSSLSGGNLQKVVIAKCLATNPQILLLNNPTRGIDVGARLEIYKLIRALTEKGIAIILLSEDLPELLHISDLIMIMRKGRVSKIFTQDEHPSEEDIITYMV